MRSHLSPPMHCLPKHTQGDGGRPQEPQQPPPSAEGPLAKDARSLLTPSCYLSGEGSIRTPKASAFPTPLRCCSLLQSSFTNTISQKGLDLCPLSFRIITWQLEKAALPSDVGLSLPLPSGANWHLLSVAHSGHCRSLRAVDPQFQRLGDTGRRTDARIPEAWAQRLRT